MLNGSQGIQIPSKSCVLGHLGDPVKGLTAVMSIRPWVLPPLSNSGVIFII